MSEVTNWRFTPTQITKDDRSTDTDELDFDPITKTWSDPQKEE